MAVPSCCISGFAWEGKPTGRIDTLAGLPTYIAGDTNSNSNNPPGAGLLVICDLLGWTFPNARLLADHYAREAGVTVYVPDFFGGEVLSFEAIRAGRLHEVDTEGFIRRHGREETEAAVFACARALRGVHDKVGAIGFCYGGWACFRLAAREHPHSSTTTTTTTTIAAALATPLPLPLVDCISVAHPSLLTPQDIDEVSPRVPVQVLAPERDRVYTPELKLRTFQKLQELGVPFEYRHFPGVEHSSLVRGDERKEGEREAMVAAKNAAVKWFKEHLGKS
ncbi:dienelactone hydrolase [Xylariales sp. PMI_506]|nr:dienelactone hydrolase [Xylariales sp. PMI_506]